MSEDKFLAIDIDGCITNGKGSSVNAHYFNEFRKCLSIFQGVSFFCTGRSAPYVEAMSQVLDINNWSICENGAYLYNPLTDEFKYHPLLTSSSLKVLNDVKTIIGSEGFRKICKPEVGKEICISLNPIGIDIESLYGIIKEIVDDEYLHVNYSTTAVDVTPAGVDKGSALLFMSDIFDINLKNIIAIGDSAGDIPFMKLAGYSACPKNSLPEVKKISDYVSRFDATKGVSDIIKNHL